MKAYRDRPELFLSLNDYMNLPCAFKVSRNKVIKTRGGNFRYLGEFLGR